MRDIAEIGTCAQIARWINSMFESIMYEYLQLMVFYPIQFFELSYNALCEWGEGQCADL